MKNQNTRMGINLYFLFIFIAFSFFTVPDNTCSAQSQKNTNDYPVLIQQADQALAAKDYPTALLLYNKASYAKPELKYAQSKIAEINAILDTDADARAHLFEDIIVKAENLYAQKNYSQAKIEYQKALTLDPKAQFPKDRLEAISAVYTDPDDLAYYNDAVANGDKAIAAADYDKAIVFYETALAVKPDSKAVKEKISNTKKLQVEFNTKADQAVKIIAGADKLLQAEKRTEARAEYQKALDLTPGNQYARQKVQEIDTFLAEKKALQDRYDKNIELADQFYINRDFANARLKYEEALKSKPEARYPKEMLEKTKSGESQLQSDQEKYDAALASAENLLKSSDYEAALMGYKSALAIKPAETYPKTKISEIEKLINERTSRKEAYDIAIKNGDQAFGEKKYDPALSHYRNALSLLPGEKYPAQKIEEINTLLAQQKSQDENYKKALTAADKLFAANKFEDAIIAYNKCLAIKPEEVYPQQKITESQNQLASARSKDENYSAAIAAADKSLSELKYDEALNSYKQALTIKPAEKYPKDKSDEINKILVKQKSDNDKYSVAIANGEKAITAGNYTVALNSFQEASGIKPTEQYPKDKIAEINAALAAQQQNDELYNAAIKNADVSFGAREYDQAIASYTEAANLKKAEKYPQEQIAKINKIIADAHSADENYNLAIAEGDKSFTNQKFTEAIASYKKAQGIKPAEEYPKTQIDKINTLIAEQEKRNADYQSAITLADQQFNDKTYEEAIGSYRKALELKPAEKYPSDKIAEAEKLIANIKALQESYDKAIANGEKSLSEKDYSNALVSFKAASGLKPSEAYPMQKINEIQAILDADKAEAQRYQEAVAQGDKLFADKKLDEAIAPYQQASTIRPSEKYPLDQIAKINQLIAEQNKLDADYLKLITDAGILLKDTKYADARRLYVNAASLKPGEKLPKGKIAEIDAILAGIQQEEANYTKAVADGDAFFTGKKYTEAITSYTSASAIKPSETYPKTQLAKINTLLTERKKLDDDYLTLITTADKSFDESNFQEAIADYRKALILKPAEKYPADRIAESENQIADLKAKQQAYENAIADGDKKFAAKDYENALTDFKTAVALKAAEPYPAQKITEIQTILDKNKAENDRYQEAISLADKFFAAEKYREALEPYQRATSIKPTEKYPQEQIIHINQLLAEQKKLDDDYQQLITDADVQMRSAKYNEAKAMYTKAGTMKPAEKLPKDKIAEIDAILADLLLKEENYTNAIKTADGFYAAKNLQGAVKSFESALAIKPQEKYPQERITAINAELKAIDDSYSKAIALGDTKLSEKDLMEALNAFQNALEIKPAEEYPRTKIAEINNALSAQKEEQEKMYASFISDGDKNYEAKDYKAAKSAYTKATGIKPTEAYPKQKIAEIDKIVEEIMLARKAEYNKALGEADKLYNTKIYDQAIDGYEAAAVINPEDPYPNQQIAKIRKYMADHAIQDLFSQTLLIKEGEEKKFTFPAVELRQRKNNYILLKARSVGGTAPKVFLNYGKDNQKNGGIVLRSLDKKEISDYLIRISVQDKWYREDNNWISLFVETGEIEISKVQIAAGDE